MKTAYSYVRFSTPEQARGDSYSRQITAAKTWCKENEYTLSEDTFFDKGKSGYRGEHLEAKGDLKRFLDLVDKKTIQRGSVLLIENYDRFSRLPYRQSLTLFLEVINSGVGLVFTASYDKRVITAELVDKDEYILPRIIGEVIRAYNESARKSELVSRAKQAKIARLRKGEKLPHNNVPKYFSWNPNKRDYEHNKNTPYVKRMVLDCLDGHSLYSIAKQFNHEKISTFRRGFEWSANSVRCILKNRVLVGEFLGNNGFFPPIIDENTFNRVQVVLSHNKNWNRGIQGEQINIFRGLAFCSKCGSTMSVVTQSWDYQRKRNWKRVYRYLRCSAHSMAKSCPSSKMFKYEKLEEDLFLDFLLKGPSELMADDSEINEITGEIAACKGRIAEIGIRINKLVALGEDLDLDELKVQLRKLKERRAEELATLDVLTLKATRYEISPSQNASLRKLCDQFQAAASNEEIAAIDEAIYQKVIEPLKDNKIRMKIRTLLPTLIGKIVIDTEANQFEVLNHTGKMIYRSPVG